MTIERARKFSVAPMMDWTDRHCRYFHRHLSRHALLFTEMVTSAALIRGGADWLLKYNDDVEHPIAVQLGGSDPKELAEATKLCEKFDYDEVNLNVGCPSDRVQSGRFGACLMAEPELVADCVKAMRDATDRPVTVKCRIGIDDQDSEEDLRIFVDHMLEAKVDALYVHARKAWLKGLSPKENREVPPLDYDRVYRLKSHVGDLPLMINGGIETIAECEEHLTHLDGVMLGRAAYHNPGLLRDVDPLFFNDQTTAISLESLCEVMTNYAEIQMTKGAKLNQIVRHMLGLGFGKPGARRYRQLLTVEAVKPNAGPELIAEAFEILKRADELAKAS
jgi:tRNA-dihydrouridine synthase A